MMNKLIFVSSPVCCRQVAMMIMMMKNEYCRSNLLLSNEPKNLQLKIARIARVNWENNLIKDALSIDIFACEK